MRSVLGYSIVAATILGIFVGNGAYADDTPARPPKCDPFKVAERYLEAATGQRRPVASRVDQG
jgi:hypothetical protein